MAQTARTIGVDTGGTFTDLVLLDEKGGEVQAKLPSTPDDPARAVLAGIERFGRSAAPTEIVHGTTVGINALLAGRAARTALVTNRGFRDLIEIGRQDRPSLYALHPRKPEPLVPRKLRFEVAQRSWPDERGRVIEVLEPSASELEALAKRIAASGAESIAVCLLHSYADPTAEERVAEALRPLGLPITLSGRLLPEHREVERFSTAIVNAALVPPIHDYLASLARSLIGARLEVLQSNGGTLPFERAAQEPVRILFSGPAGGVVGAARAAREAALGDIVALDMGGTSTDVAFHAAGRPPSVAAGASVAGHPVGVPALDIHTIGCGGGSLARVDAGGVLRVGPESAGASPGPVCYGRGEQPTVTDAHVLLGHVAQGAFLGGEVALDVDRVRLVFEVLGRELGTSSEAAAQAVIEVARAAMRRAVGVMTMQRGEDPGRLPLVAFGGAGGLAAAALAESLDMPGALVPARPGLLSAYGMALADAIREHVETALEPLDLWPAARRAAVLRTLAARGSGELVASGYERESVEIELALDLRYAGQSFEIRMPEGGKRRAVRASPRADALAEAFHRRHAELYGYRLDDRPIELVGLRARALARRANEPKRARAARAKPIGKSHVVAKRPAWFGGRRVDAPVIYRGHLEPGHVFAGPALVEEFSGTTLVPPGWRARVTRGGHLWLQRAARRRKR